MSITYSSLNHPLRIHLAAEVHSRPFLRLDAPERLTHLAIYSHQGSDVSEGSASTHYEMLSALCVHFGVARPSAETKYFFYDFGRFRLKWECHTEFSTYTFAEKHETTLLLTDAFSRVPLSHLPHEWLLGLRGKIIVAAHVVLDRSDVATDVAAKDLRQLFEGNMLVVGSQVLQGGEIWTDFQIQSDGFSRFVVRDVGLREQQAGHLIQRVLEIETYRMMALLGLPHAQKSAPILNVIEAELAMLTATMVDTDALSSSSLMEVDDEQALLRQITGLAARIEKLSLENSYRFSASQAYFRIVQSRIEELREIRIEGVPTVGEFMDRRLAPAMNTCTSTARRQEALAERIAHTNDLLRTRVGIVQEQQNRKILQSMNKRAAQQLRLQQAVEGLSVVAISYYLAGLFNYAGKAAKGAGWPINPDIMTGILVPIIAIGVWLGLRSLHKNIHTL
ncbi:DUF3422 family protein [Glaciimonas immobilis]|uniref:Putative membrane-anchored protein n=1 Tax=Glaciimonas immobilis TaxID=728004 RepID=A0A840RY86_9BURK|nr:DUF3422 domain-containing protein [Glaciimonas immobilis]KAF3996045.1 DUF3422 domain-containing protein [Glaciimonas immobilis]MBB5201826.1 putative membrane-anchored protein [Glaciimonas immobilis]